ncbi:hypothetical protein [Sphingopyxis sp. SCN 67-31]|uniref:hypothetical protein n=1 Tax=Sphingopyxis sp. SCN 67-31 TaxID=1660142 RepID=UPI00086F88C1|nr:hypothetical protein [Sphingopyxis sp. SCN 67-31]ODU28761.1 MAG: hypothetical protein ABS88_11275 [Sphingopyxis sp. SCN 67-31]
MAKPENPYAFPWRCDDNTQAGDSGMELRDWLAGQALIGILSSGTTHMTSGQTIDGYHAMVAYGAYALADAMLLARQTTDREDGK